MNCGPIIRLNPYVAHILGLCCADSSECEDPYATTDQVSAKDLLGQGGESFSVLQTGKVGGSSPYCMATCVALTDKQRQIAYACHARQDVAESPQEELAFSKCDSVNFSHPPCITVRSAACEMVRLMIGNWAGELDAATWIEDACQVLAEQSRKTDHEILAAGESSVDFEILIPKALVAFLQPGILSATSLRNAIQPVPGYAGPALIDILSESPLYVSEAFIGAKLHGTVKHGGAPELLIPHPNGIQVVPLEGSADLSEQGPLLMRELTAFNTEADCHPESWSLLSVRVESSDILLDLLDPPQWPLAPPRAVLAATCHFRLGPLHPCPAEGDIHALIDFATGVLNDIGKALGIDNRLLCFAQVEPDGAGSLVEVVFLADEEDVQGQIDKVAAHQEGSSNVVIEESSAPLSVFYKFAHMVRKKLFVDKEEYPYMKDIDKTFVPQLTQRLVYTNLDEIVSIWEAGGGVTNNWDTKILQPLQQYYTQKDLYKFFEKRRLAEQALASAMEDPKRDEDNLAKCIALGKEAEVSAERIQEAEQRLDEWSRLRIMLAAQAELDAAEAAKDPARLAEAIERAREQGVDELRIQKAERELARILAAERLNKAMDTATSSDVVELRAAIEAARAAGVDSDLIRHAVALLNKLEAEEKLKRRRIQCHDRLRVDVDEVNSFLDNLIEWIHNAASELAKDNEIPAPPDEEWFREDGITMLQASIKEAIAAQVDSGIVETGQTLMTTWASTWQLTTALQGGPEGKVQRLKKSVDIAKPGLEGHAKGEAMLTQCMDLIEHWDLQVRQKIREEYMTAIKAADIETIKRLLESWSVEEVGEMIDFRDADGRTPFLLSALYGNIEMMKLFHERGADVEAEDPNSNNALDLCVDQLLAGATPVIFTHESVSATGGGDVSEDADGASAAVTTTEATTAQENGGEADKELSSKAFGECIDYIKKLKEGTPPIKLHCKRHVYDIKREYWRPRPPELFWLIEVKNKLSKKYGSCMGAYRVMDGNNNHEVSYTELQTVLLEFGYEDRSDDKNVPTIKAVFKLLDVGVGNDIANRDFCLTPKEFELLDKLDEDMEMSEWQEKLLQ